MEIAKKVAVVGLACRFPGHGNTPTAFWQNLLQGVDGFSEVPPQRWSLEKYYDSDPSVPGKMYTRECAFIDQDPREFDAAFFEMSPREAANMDPQQRLLLEVSWEAFESAGLKPALLGGSKTGVFVGGFMTDHYAINMSSLAQEQINSHTSVGITLTMLSARLSYFYNLIGPCFSVDTACSSSLVATHQAVRSVQSGESDLALVAGVNIIYNPLNQISLCKAGLLSRRSRCHAFDERADGYARGEGAGCLLLKPLEKAMADGDHIYAVIAESGINQDGHSDGGITSPALSSQRKLLEEVYRRANVAPEDVQYVEAHGTGTQRGDTTEASALGQILGKGRAKDRPLVIGSVKTNIGHLEAAAGVAGLIKAVLCVHHGKIPPNLHFQTPNSAIDFDGLRLEVSTAAVDWPSPREGMPRIAGVNSFGYGGTNAHVVIEQAPTRTEEAVARVWAKPSQRKVQLLPIAARSAEGLMSNAKALASMLGDKGPNGVSLPALSYSLGTIRTQHRHRICVAASTSSELIEDLTTFGNTGRADNTIRDRAFAPGNVSKICWVFSGMGPQWWGMGRQLLVEEPSFRETMEACDEVFKRDAQWSLLAELKKPEGECKIHKTEYAQPANFALQAGLAALYRQWGYAPGSVVGHSVGEITSGYLSGALSLEQAAKVAVYRSRAQAKAAGLGAMLATSLSHQEAKEMVAPYGGRVSVAAVNSPTNVTLSGERPVLEAIAYKLDQNEIFNRFLRVEVPYHSHFMDGIKDDLYRWLGALTPKTPDLPLLSTVTGDWETGVVFDAEYWVRNCREPVLFFEAIVKAVEAGATAFLEIGPHPVLSASVNEVLSNLGKELPVIASLVRKKDEARCLMLSVGALHASGHEPDWAELSQCADAHRDIPTYAWARQPYWAESTASQRYRTEGESHPLLSTRQEVPTPLWRSTALKNRPSFVQDHVIQGEVIMPGAAFIDMALSMLRQACATEADPDASLVLSDMQISSALVLSDEPTAVFARFDRETAAFTIHSQGADDAKWKMHALGRGRLVKLAPDRVSIPELKASMKPGPTGDAVYEELRRRGYEYGPRFRGITQVWDGGDRMLAAVRPPSDLGESERYVFHPALLDIVLHNCLLFLSRPEAAQNTAYVPTSAQSVVFHAASDDLEIFVLSRLHHLAHDRLTGDVEAYDRDGRLLVGIYGIEARPTEGMSAFASAAAAGWLYDVQYSQPVPLVFQPVEGKKTVVLYRREGSPVPPFVDQLKKNHRLIDAPFLQDPDSHQVTVEGRPLAGHLANVDVRIDTLIMTSGLGGNDPNDPGLTEAMVDDVLVGLQLCQAWQMSGHRERSADCLAWCVTEGVHQNRGDVVPQGAWISGFLRSARASMPELALRHLDLPPRATSAQLENAARLVVGGHPLGNCYEVALHGDGEFLTPELVRLSPDELAFRRENIANTHESEMKATVAIPGKVTSVGFVGYAPPSLGKTDVRVKVLASALTERDLLRITEADSPDKGRRLLDTTFLGTLAIGEVEQTGGTDLGVRIGDRVWVASFGAMSTYLVAPASRVAKIDPSATVEHLAGLVDHFLAYAILANAMVKKDSLVLVVPGYGGFERALVEVVTALGGRAEILGEHHTTAAGYLEKKWDYLVTNRSSRLDKSLVAGLKRNGRIVLVGARSLYENRVLSPDDFPKGGSLSAIDPEQLLVEMDSLQQTWEAFAALNIQPSANVRRLPVSDLATRVDEWRGDDTLPLPWVDFRSGPIELLPALSLRPLFDEAKSYVVTGGLGGVGTKFAQWMIDNGAKHVVLTGRLGSLDAERQAALRELQRRAPGIIYRACDITDLSATNQLISSIETDGPPLDGVFHAAARFPDTASLLEDASIDEYLVTMTTKAQGAWNLHLATERLPLRYFGLFSSAAGVYGGVRLEPYAAANTFLDALVKYRRARSLSGCTFLFGAVKDVGILKRENKMAETWESIGSIPMLSLDMFQPLPLGLRLGIANFIVAHINWIRVGKAQPVVAAQRLFDRVRAAEDAIEGNSARDRLAAELWAMDAPEQRNVVADRLRGVLQQVLGATGGMDLTTSILDFGVDSLLAATLRARFSECVGFEVPVFVLLKGPTLLELADRFLKEVLGEETMAGVEMNDDDVLAVLAELEDV